MKKRVRLYKAQMGGYNAAQQVQQQQQAPTEQQMYDYVLASLGDGKEPEEIHAELVQSGIPEEISKKVIEDSVTYLEEQQANEEAAQTPNDEDSQKRLEEEEMMARRRQEDEEAEQQYNQQLQEMYADYNEHDYSDDESLASDLVMRKGGNVPSKRTFVKNVMKLTKKQLGGQETQDKNRADSTDTGERAWGLKAFVGSLQGHANDALMKEDAKAMYNQYFQDGGDTESGMMDFDPYHNLAHYSDTFEHAMPEEMTSMMKAQEGGMSPGQARRMQRRTDRIIRNIPVGYGGYGAGMFPQGINILNIAQPQMMAAQNNTPLSNFTNGVRMANIDVRRVGLFGRPKEYTINFANDVATNPQLQKELMEQEARNTRQTIKDITDAGYTTTVTDSGIKGSSSTVPTEGQATDFFKKDDNTNKIPDYLEITGGPNDMGASSTTPPMVTGTGGGGSRTGSGGGRSGGGNNFTETEEELVLDEETGAYVPASMKAAFIQNVNKQSIFNPYSFPGNPYSPPGKGKYAPDIYTLPDKKGFYYTVNEKGNVEKYKGSPNTWSPSAKPIATIKDQSTINYVIDKGKAYTPSKTKTESNFPTLQEWLKSKGYPNSPKYVQQYNIEKNGSKELTAAKSSGASLAKTFGSTTPPTKNNSTPVKEYTKNGIKVQVYTKYQTDAQTGKKFPIKIVKRFDSKGKLLDNSYVEFTPYKDYGPTKIPYNQYFGKKQQGGIISNPFEDPYGNLQKFIYGGGDDISIPEVAGKLTDDAYFQYGGLTEYADKGQVTEGPYKGNRYTIYTLNSDPPTYQVRDESGAEVFRSKDKGAAESYINQFESTSTAPRSGVSSVSGAEPKAGQKKADWEKASGYSSTGEGGDLVWDGKSWVKASDYKPSTTSSKTSNTTTSNTNTTSNPKTTTTTTNTTMFPGQVAPIYPPLFGAGLLRGRLGANALAFNPFIQYAGSWTQQRGQAFDPATGKPIDITGMENTPLSRIKVDKVGLLSGRPKKYTMYFGEPVAEGTSSTGAAAATSQETRDAKGKRKMAPGLEKALLRIPGMSRVLYPYGDEEEATVTPTPAVATPVDENDELANLYWGHPTLNTGNVKNQNITMPIKPSSEMRLETSYDREKAAMGEAPMEMPIIPSSGMSIPTSMGEQQLAGEQIPVLPLRPPGEVMSTAGQQQLALQEYMQNPAARESLMQFIPEEEQMQMMETNPDLSFGQNMTGPFNSEISPEEIEAYDDEQYALQRAQNPLNNEKVRYMYESLGKDIPEEPTMGELMGYESGNVYQSQNPFEDNYYNQYQLPNQQPLPEELISEDLIASQDAKKAEKEKLKQQQLLRQKQLQQLKKFNESNKSNKSSGSYKTKNLTFKEGMDNVKLMDMEDKLLKQYEDYGVSNLTKIQKDARARIANRMGSQFLKSWAKMTPSQKLGYINAMPKNSRNDFILISKFEKGGQLRKAQIGQANNYTTNPDMVGLSDIDLVSSQTAPISGLPSSTSTWPSQMPARFNQRKDPTMLSLDPNQMNRQTQKKQFDLGFQPGPGVDFSTGQFPSPKEEYSFEPGQGVDFSTGEFPDINPNNYGYAFQPGEGVDFATGEFPEINEQQPTTEAQTPDANKKGFAVKFKEKNMYNIDPQMGLNIFNKFANAGLQGLENREAKRQERENNKQLIGDNLYGSTNIMSRGTYNVNSGLLDESTMGSVRPVKYGGYLQDGGYVIDEESMYDVEPIENNWMDGSRLQSLYMNQNYMNASPEYLNSMISQGVADEEEDEEYAEGGVTYMSEDQIRKFMQEGGELEFV